MAKIIDRWQLTVRTGGETDGGAAKTEVTVPVKMEQRGSQTVFLVDFKYGEHHLQANDRDIDALRARTIQWLQNVVDYVWEDYLYVELEVDDDKRVAGDERTVRLGLSCRRYQKVRNHAGDPVYRDLSGRYNGGRITDSLWRQDEGLLLEKTPENEAAVAAAFAGLVSLIKRMALLLGPAASEERLLSRMEQMLDRPLREAAPPKRKR